jgi:hypothetical protein
MARELHWTSHGLGHGTQHHCGIIRMMALLALACATAEGVSEAAAGSDTEQCRSDPHEACRFMAGSDDVSSARRRPAPRRLRIEVRRQFFTDDDPGTVYGYPPGNYILGPYGILYGPYPIRRSPSPVLFDY